MSQRKCIALTRPVIVAERIRGLAIFSLGDHVLSKILRKSLICTTLRTNRAGHPPQNVLRQHNIPYCIFFAQLRR